MSMEGFLIDYAKSRRAYSTKEYIRVSFIIRTKIDSKALTLLVLVLPMSYFPCISVLGRICIGGVPNTAGNYSAEE